MTSGDRSDDPEDPYALIESQSERITDINASSSVLRWDQEVMMPSGGTPARARQLSTLSSLSHETLTDDSLSSALDRVDEGSLDGPERAVVREIRREHDRATQVPTSLVSEISETVSNAHPIWQEAKENDDFDSFEPILSKLVELKREYADHIDPSADPYAVLFAEYEPYLSLETAESVLAEVRDGLVPMIDAISAADTEIPPPDFDVSFPADRQERLSRAVLDTLGYDWDRGRLDTAPHPFSMGTPFDARVTTRFDESNPLEALTSTIHEFGHASYTLGLPEEHYGTPLGSARDLTVHESQSRLWENHIGRSLPFWERILPTVTETFSSLESLTPESAYRLVNRVYDDNLIRVEADELTYHLHIVIRFEIERGLIEGSISPAEVPSVWNDKYDEYLGVRPESDSEGCLQDIHWSHGSFGYFPTYSLGSVLAAQLYSHLTSDIADVDERIRAGEFDAVREWLIEHVHRHGCRYTTPELIEKATGEAYTASHFVSYIEEKYSRLYEL